MKKVLALVLAALLALSVFGCKKPDAPEESKAPVEESKEESKAPVEEAKATGFALDIKNKTGKTITGLYIYETGAANKGNSLVTNLPDKDDDGDNYEIFAYIVREVKSDTTFDFFIEWEDGTNATWAGRTINDYDKFSFKSGTDPEKWEQEPAKDEDKADMDAVKAIGKTTDNFYPGYVALGLEIKNKTDLAITGFYFYEKGADPKSYNNMVGNMLDATKDFAYALDADGNKMAEWKPGSAKTGGLYVFGFFLRPDTNNYEVLVEFADGTSFVVTDITNIVQPNAGGEFINEISLKSATDPDETKIAYDDNENDALPCIAGSIANGIPADGWYPTY